MRAKQWATGQLLANAEVDPAVKTFMEMCNTLAGKHEVNAAANAMAKCEVQLIHRVKVDLKDKKHEHKMIVVGNMAGS